MLDSCYPCEGTANKVLDVARFVGEADGDAVVVPEYGVHLGVDLMAGKEEGEGDTGAGCVGEEASGVGCEDGEGEEEW